MPDLPPPPAAPSGTAPRCVLVTGLPGADGSHLVDVLVARGHEVHAVLPAAAAGPAELDEVEGVVLHRGELTDTARLVGLISGIAPDDVYHLALGDAASSFDEPGAATERGGLATLRLLEAIRLCEIDARFVQAVPSHILGPLAAPGTESSAVAPRSPAAAAGAFAYWTARTYRESHGLFAATGVVFGRESVRTGPATPGRRIARAVARVAAGSAPHVELADPDVVREWGDARDHAAGLELIAGAAGPADYVLATGVPATAGEFARRCLEVVGLDGARHVRVTGAESGRPEDDGAVGDASRARRELGWRPAGDLTAVAQELVHAALAAEPGAAGRGARSRWGGQEPPASPPLAG